LKETGRNGRKKPAPRSPAEEGAARFFARGRALARPRTVSRAPYARGRFFALEPGAGFSGDGATYGEKRRRLCSGCSLKLESAQRIEEKALEIVIVPGIRNTAGKWAGRLGNTLKIRRNRHVVLAAGLPALASLTGYGWVCNNEAYYKRTIAG